MFVSKRHWPLALFGLLFLFAFLPPAIGEYGAPDDYSFLNSAAVNDGIISDVLWSAGRPLNAFLIQASFGSIESIFELSWLRVLSAAFVTLLLMNVYTAVCRLGNCDVSAASVVAIAALTPSTLVVIAWAQHWSVALGANLTFLAWGLVNARTLARRQINPFAALILAITGTLVLACAGLINQSLLGFFAAWTLIGVWYAPPSARLILERLVGNGLVASVALMLDYVVLKMTPGVTSRAQLTTDVIGKLQWFVLEPLPNASSAVMVWPENSMLRWSAVGAVWIVIIVGFLMRREEKLPIRLLRLACLIALLFAAYPANLVVAENWASYRSIWSLAFLITLAFAFCLHRLSATISWSRLIIHGVAVISTIVWVLNYERLIVRPYSAELAIARREILLANYELGQREANRILFVIPDWTETSTLIRYDEFGARTIRNWAAWAVTRLVLQEHPEWVLTRRFPSMTRELIDIPDREKARAARNSALIIDMSGYGGKLVSH